MISFASFVVNVSSATTTQVVAGTAGYKTKVAALFLENVHATQDVNVTFKTGTTALHGSILLKAGGGSWTLPYCAMSWFDTAAGDALNLVTDAAGSIQGVVKYGEPQA